VKIGKSFRESLFDSTVRTFGHGCAFGSLDECLPRDDEWAGLPLDGVPMFILAASSDEGSGGVRWCYTRFELSLGEEERVSIVE